MTFSANVTVSVDLASLDATIARMAGVEAIIVKYGTLVMDAAKRYAPYRTGALRNEIHMELEAMAATIISDMPYSAVQEYGGSRTRAHPYMRPALEQYREAFLREIEALIGA